MRTTRTNLFVPVILVAMAALGLSACSSEGSGTEPAAPSTTQTSPAPATEPAAFTNEKGELMCPVMKTVIKSKEDAVGFADHDGVRYYFCCDGCPEQFKADPSKYAKGGG